MLSIIRLTSSAWCLEKLKLRHNLTTCVLISFFKEGGNSSPVSIWNNTEISKSAIASLTSPFVTPSQFVKLRWRRLSDASIGENNCTVKKKHWSQVKLKLILRIECTADLTLHLESRLFALSVNSRLSWDCYQTIAAVKVLSSVTNLPVIFS